MTVYTVVCGAVSLALALLFRSGHPSHWVASLWARLILGTCGVRVDVRGSENLQPMGTYLLASNHQSLFDTPILFGHLPISFRILYKRSLNRVPFLGWHLFMSGHIGVERESPKKARESLEHAAQRIRRGTSVVVFPEGTRSFDGVLRPFKKGSFRLALRAGIPIVPLTIADSHLVMRRSEVTVHPRRITLTIDRPIPLDNLRDDEAELLADRVRAIVSRNLEATRT